MPGQLDVSLVLRARDQGFSAEVKGSEQELRALGRAGQAVAPQIDRTTSALARAATGAGRLRGAMGQLGFQAQDIAIQLAAGVAPLQVLAVQGGQAAAAFGPLGAALGTVITVGGILAGVLFGLGRDTDDAGDAADRAADNFDKLHDIMTSLHGEASATSEALQAAARNLISDAERGVDGLQRQIRELTMGVQSLADLTPETARNPEFHALRLSKLQKELSAARQELALLRAEAGQFGGEAAAAAQTAAKGIRETTDERKAAAREQSEIGRALARQAREEERAAMEALRPQLTLLDKIAQAERDLAVEKKRTALVGVEGGDRIIDKLERENELRADGIDLNSELARRYLDVTGALDRQRDATADAQKQEREHAKTLQGLVESTDTIGDAFSGLDREVSSSLAHMITENKLALSDFADFARDITTSILQGIIEIGIQTGLNFAFAPSSPAVAPETGPGGLLVGGGVTSAGVGHEGGLVGALARQRTVPPSLFADAPRFHQGGMVLDPGEVPIIAQRGERITPAGQGGPVQIVQIINQTGARIEQRQSRGPQGEDIMTVIVREVANRVAKGDLDIAMKGRFGLRT